MIRNRWTGVAFFLALAPCTAISQALLVERTISFNAARDAANAALDQCRRDGMHVTITVLDHSGRTRLVMHDDGAAPHTIENSLRKAYTALSFRQPSGEAGKRFTSDPSYAGMLSLELVTTLAGGLPIRAGNDVVGAIGISGSPNTDQDVRCAQVGIDRISKGLTGG